MKHTPAVVAAARVLNARGAEQCGVNAEDSWEVYGEDFLQDAEMALAAAGLPELLEALQRLVGVPDDPNNGWRGGGTHELYACEYCGQKHSDCRAIPHTPTCPVPTARAAIAKATGEEKR